MTALFPTSDLPVFWLWVPLMLAIIWCDLRYMRLPHILLWITLALAAGTVIAGLDMMQLIWRAVAAIVMLGVGLAAFAARAIGGGDVKILAGLMLLIPTPSLTLFVFLLGVSLLAGIAAVTAARKHPRAANSTWVSLTRTNAFPVGLSIGMAGLALAALT